MRSPAVETRISVLVSTYKRPALLWESLSSLLAQSYAHWEAIVIDNDSQGTAESVVKGFNERRIRYLMAPVNLGECGGRNLALSTSTGAYVCYLDDDDVLPPRSLERRLDFYRRHPGCGMIYTDYDRVALREEGNGVIVSASEKRRYFHKAYYDRLLERLHYERDATYALLKKFNFVRGGTPLVQRSTFEAVGAFDERLSRYGDYEMWLRIAKRFPIRFLDEKLYTYRIHRGCHHLRLSKREDRRMALEVCRRHQIRDSVEFARYHRAIRLFWHLCSLDPTAPIHSRRKENNHGQGREGRPLSETERLGSPRAL